MLVKELIEKLKGEDPDNEVMLMAWDDWLHDWSCDIVQTSRTNETVTILRNDKE